MKSLPRPVEIFSPALVSVEVLDAAALSAVVVAVVAVVAVVVEDFVNFAPSIMPL